MPIHILHISAYRLGGIAPLALLPVIFIFALTLSTVACKAESTSHTTPTSLTSTADSIDVVYSLVPSIRGGSPLSPLFGDMPEDREAINRLALALDSVVPTGASARIAVDERGRYLTIRFREGNTLTVRRVLQCQAQPEIARMAPGAGSCNGRYVPLADTWWVEDKGLVNSPDLGLWWEDMPNFMAPIGLITLPDTLEAGQPFPLTTCCWPNILRTPTMDLSLVTRDGAEIALGRLSAGSEFSEFQLTVPDRTPEGRYWLRVSSNGFSELVDLVLVQ